MDDDARARNRLLAYTAVRFGGLAIFFVGVAIMYTNLLRPGGPLATGTGPLICSCHQVHADTILAAAPACRSARAARLRRGLSSRRQARLASLAAGCHDSCGRPQKAAILRKFV